MVAKIKTGKSLIGAINYNEHKVKTGKATLIAAPGYLKEPSQMLFHDKLNRLTDLAKRNERTTVNTLHVSLNFAVGENLSAETLQQIADDYMQGLGFGNQPYLLYQHIDAGHPHLHLVSTNIQPDGKRISFHHLANEASEDSRKGVEEKYSLVKAEDQPKANSLGLQPLAPADYGKGETKRMITNIVNEVIRQYKFTGIGELNAVLQQYRVLADRGAKDSRMYQKEGLTYWLLDAKGNKIGVPIKASSIYGKPTLATLSQKFELNEMLRKPVKAQLIAKLNKVTSEPLSERQFLAALNHAGVSAIIRKNNDGRIYGATYIDQQTKVVYNGSDLDNRFSANQLANYFSKTSMANDTETYFTPKQNAGNPGQPAELLQNDADSLLGILTDPEKNDQTGNNKLKKKKRKGQSL